MGVELTFLLCMNKLQHEIYEPCSPEMQHTSDNRKILTCTLLHVFDIYLSYQCGGNSLDHIMEIIKINIWAVERSLAI